MHSNLISHDKVNILAMWHITSIKCSKRKLSTRFNEKNETCVIFRFITFVGVNKNMEYELRLIKVAYAIKHVCKSTSIKITILEQDKNKQPDLKTFKQGFLYC